MHVIFGWIFRFNCNNNKDRIDFVYYFVRRILLSKDEYRDSAFLFHLSSTLKCGRCLGTFTMQLSTTKCTPSSICSSFSLDVTHRMYNTDGSISKQNKWKV